MDNEQVLRLLAPGEWITGERISAEMGLTRAAVWKQMERLREEGWEIESGGKRGYRLRPGDRLEPALWQGLLTTREMGRGQVCLMQETASTNLLCKKFAQEGAPNGSVYIAECQKAGKGRLGRTWVSEPGMGLWQSVLLRPRLRPEQAPLITLCAAMAMAQAVRECTGLDVRVKWPNDLVCEGKKLCGILLEMSADPDAIEYVVVGVGLNVQSGAVPPALRGQAAAIADFAVPPPRRVLLVRYLAALEEILDRLEQAGFAGIEAAYRGWSCTIGQAVRVVGAVNLTGTAEGLDETGALLVRDEAGQCHRVLSGDVSVRGVMGYV